MGTTTVSLVAGLINMRLVISVLVMLLGLPLIADEIKSHQQNPIAIVIHGGAGTILKSRLGPALEAAYRLKLSEASEAGYAVLASGESSQQAVIAAIKVMENSELFNAGKGAVFTAEAKVELDASIMEGKTLNAGAITGVTQIKNPIELASLVMTQSKHVMFTGLGAETFAEQQGIELIDNSYFQTDRRLKSLQRVQAEEKKLSLLSLDRTSSEVTKIYDVDPMAIVSDKRGTVGAVALDRSGTISAGTSTGGMTNKRYGRVGDSPIIGAGTYADNNSCGISATGHGEYFIRAAVAHDICARSEYLEIDLQQAADQVIQVKLVEMNASGGVIGLDPQGNIVYSFNSDGMYRAHIDTSGKRAVAIFK